jgi:hypothetical protein
MADPLRSTDDIPAFDTYPAPEGMAAAADLEAPGEGAGYNPRTRGSLAEASGQFAESLSRARGLARELPQRMEAVRERFDEVRGRLGEESSRQFDRAKIYADRAWHDARYRADRLRRERPLQLLAGAALAAFAVGVLLRMGRSRRG